MRHAGPILLTVMAPLASVLAPAASFATPLAAGQSGDIQFAAPYDLTRDVDILDLDPDGHDAAQIAAVTARGVTPVCYVSVGTVEDYRDDADAFPPEVLGRVHDDWPDEHFLDIRRLDVLLPIMSARFDTCRTLGFESVDPDNVEGHDNDTGFPLTGTDAVAYLRALADLAHGKGLAIGRKNVPDLTPDLVDVLDFAVTEGCGQEGWCADLAPYIAAGKPVLAIEYTDRTLDRSAICAEAASLGLSTVIKDRALTGAVAACPQ